MLLMFFGISIGSFRVGGGILLLLMAISMMHARLSNVKQTPEEAIDKGAPNRRSCWIRNRNGYNRRNRLFRGQLESGGGLSRSPRNPFPCIFANSSNPERRRSDPSIPDIPVLRKPRKGGKDEDS
jgi:hypothetical protein